MTDTPDATAAPATPPPQQPPEDIGSAVRQHRIRIDWTLNITTVATLVLSLMSGVWWVSSIQASNDKRLTLLEAQAAAQRQVDAGQDVRWQQELTLIRQSLQRIEDKQDAALLRGAR